MPLCDHLSAVDDQAAVEVLQTPGGPEQGDFDVVLLKNIDPVLAIAQLEAAVTACGYEEASARPRCGRFRASVPDCVGARRPDHVAGWRHGSPAGRAPAA
ncbi:hypothetical protein [Yinghuangia seranimata]|uniref:hypothetical protein n=1 Tax=Yinghuangia seranimata TaxID=408067 RepID=UPI00248B6331|nr:hypothetical protein [Yinghuangia seranimata]MDI2129954.1 hypothetical protein [Yinghuangia seranimata]MDI2131632.1 hypothetical protein [Yinghuangia seranimata]